MLPSITGIGDEAAAGLSGQIAVARDLNWSDIELRTVDRVAVADLTEAAFRAVTESLSEAGLGVACLASRIGNWARPITSPFEQDLSELETLARRCAVLNCRYVRIMSYPNDGLAEHDWRDEVIRRVRALARRAEQLGVILVHENCAGWAGSSAARMMHLLRSVDSPALRLLFDTGNGIAYGYDSYSMLCRILPHVEHVHIKDAVPEGGDARYTLPGDGESRVVDCLRLLLSSGYAGWLSLEPHLAARPHDGVSALADAAPRFAEANRTFRQLLHRDVGLTAATTPLA